VSRERSTAETPSTTTPSVAIFSAGSHDHQVADLQLRGGNLTSTLSRRMRASAAPSSASFLIAAEARPFARSSR
jgi:hypothetical protein